jgi:hypothetical protein
VRVSGGHDDISRDLGVHDLGNDVLVCDTDNQTVLGGVVLVFRLSDKTLAGIVVRLAL